jgi:hypothetical protein
MSDPAAHQPQKAPLSSRGSSRETLEVPEPAGAPPLPPLSGERMGEHEPGPIDDEPSKGINLTLVYSLIALALVAAIGFALLIVLPFYHRR